MALRGILRRAIGPKGYCQNRRPSVEGLESRQLLALSIAEFPTQLIGGQPTSIVTGSDGNLWFTLPSYSELGSINPSTHAIQTFFIRDLLVSNESLTSGSDGNLWFLTAASVESFNPTTHAITETALPIGPSFAGAITDGPGGNLWFTLVGSGTTNGGVGEINPTTHVITEFTGEVGGDDLTLGPDGNLWFADRSGSIDSFNPATQTFSRYPSPTGRVLRYNAGEVSFDLQGPSSITTGPGGNLWFTERDGNRVGSINPTTHAISEYFLPTPNSFPTSITAGPDGKLYFTESGFSDYPGQTSLPYGRGAIGTIDPTTHVITTYPTPSINSNPQGITVGPDGHLWFAEAQADQIGEGVIHPADGPRVTSVSRYGYHAQPTSLVLAFNQPLDAASARDAANYAIVGPNHRPVRIAAAVYDATANTVTLVPAARLNVHWNYTLTVNGTAPRGVRDVYGTFLDGAGTGQPGSDYVTTITRSNLVLSGVVPRGPARIAGARPAARAPHHR